MIFPFINVKAQYEHLKDSITSRMARVLEHGQFIMGPEVIELENELSNFAGSKYCITVGSGTDALLISLMAHDIGIGDEVITSVFSFAATAEAIALLGATPVFIDIDPETCNIDVGAIPEKITGKTKAILPVSLYGQPADMDSINALAAQYGIPVIEDGAQSFGAKYLGKNSCNISTIGCTSFFPSKPLGCYGDGGAIFTNDKVLADLCRSIRVHGQEGRYWHTRIGLGGRMDTIQCAVVLSKLTVFRDELQARKNAADFYDKEIKKLEDKFNDPLNNALDVPIRRINIKHGIVSAYGQYTIALDERELVMRHLNENGIPTAIHYPRPLNQQPAFEKYCCPECTPNANSVSTKVLSLPICGYITYEEQKRVIKLLHGALDNIYENYFI
jgi:UDP-2-acetamido-2-deoxy-ribo-hexuluronate aminotransferase